MKQKKDIRNYYTVTTLNRGKTVIRVTQQRMEKYEKDDYYK